jgi:hypothetical protein
VTRTGALNAGRETPCACAVVRSSNVMHRPWWSVVQFAFVLWAGDAEHKASDFLAVSMRIQRHHATAPSSRRSALGHGVQVPHLVCPTLGGGEAPDDEHTSCKSR